MLHDEIQKIIDTTICDSESTRVSFLKRLEKGALTRDENPQTHYCVSFFPYNAKDKKVFITLHKKTNLWLSPGGHIDKGEKLFDTLNREIYEELGVKNFFQEAPSPFLLSIFPIENKAQTCKVHFEIWYLILTDGLNFKVNPREFHETRWLTIGEAEKIVTDAQTRKALDTIKKKYIEQI